MAVPDFQSIMRPLLEFASDQQIHSIQDAYEDLAEFFRLTAEDLEKRVPSGQQPTFKNRLSWANTYLKKAGLLEAPKRGHFKITELGMDVLTDAPERIDINFLSQFKDFIEFRDKRSKTASADPDSEIALDEGTPQETFDASYRSIRNEIETELLETLKTITPARFEKIVVDLLVKMGYGGSREDAGERIGRSGDEGIDGTINEDKLGLDVVYIQAKRWQDTVGRPEIQKFAGALQGQRARKGVFITTSGFSPQAYDFVSNIESKIILINGQEFAEYMYDYNIGLSITETYEIKKIDSDYFE
jgi:restriction system protein